MTIKSLKLTSRRLPFERPDASQEALPAVSDGRLRWQAVKRSFLVGGHKVHVRMEEAFWVELRLIAHDLGIYLPQLVASIDAERQHGNLSSAIRLFVFEYRSHDGTGEPMSPAAQAVLGSAQRHRPMH
jgi:predicted DNA-binding ribbon-helix-helix protein